MDRRVGVTLTRIRLNFTRMCLHVCSPQSVCAASELWCGLIRLYNGNILTRVRSNIPPPPESFFTLTKQAIITFINTIHMLRRILHAPFILSWTKYIFRLNVVYVGTISTLNDNTVWMVRGVSHLHTRMARPMNVRILISISANWEIHTNRIWIARGANSHVHRNYYRTTYNI